MKDRFKTELIQEYLTKNDLSIAQFCKTTNIAEKDLNKIFNQDFDIDIYLIFKLSKILQIKIHEFFETV